MKTVLFDLDGTLLPMDQDRFVNGYFGLLAKKAAPYGYESQKLIKTIWGGTAAMVKNDGRCPNEEVFWRYFAGVYGEESRKDIAMFDAFYANEFRDAQRFCGFDPKAAEAVHLVHELGGRAVLATNPLFPEVATRTRLRWIGLEPEDFVLYPTYQNINFCKPNLDYYREILRRLDARPEDCLMVGNDVAEDMVASRLGMCVFLVTDCLINTEGVDISVYPHGDFSALLCYLREDFFRQGPAA